MDTRLRNHLIIVAVLAMIVIAMAWPSDGAPAYCQTPTPMQKKERDRAAIEEDLIKTKIALAYSCGYMEGRTRIVDKACMEMRDIATEKGFRK